ncbi:MAG: Hsp20/alpha crystallin family protein [Chlorobium sp.]|jgi:HSP20 family protein|nr:MAG: Hsp20/alpha crystallin family protein [Chlorobium sp.]
MSLTIFKRDPMKLFENVLNDNVSPFVASIVAPSFKVDIAEDESAIFIEADMPGIKKEDIKVSMDDDLLTISAERSHDEEEKTKEYHRTERSWGCLSRSFTVGENVDPENIEAAYDNGVLKIKVPKKAAEPKKGKEITVK